MKKEDIITLAKAGFTAQQIAQLAADGPEAAPAAPDQAPAAPDQAPAAPDQAPAPAVNPDLVQQLLDRIDGIENKLQKAALLNSQQDLNEDTADKILASIINPPGVE